MDEILWPIVSSHDDVILKKHFPCYWPFVRGIQRSPANSLHKGQWRGALTLSLIFDWINGWINNREAGDLIRHRADYDISVMMRPSCSIFIFALCIFTQGNKLRFSIQISLSWFTLMRAQTSSPPGHEWLCTYLHFVNMSKINKMRPRRNCRHFADDIFKCILLYENVWISQKISLKFVFKFPIYNIQVLVSDTCNDVAPTMEQAIIWSSDG